MGNTNPNTKCKAYRVQQSGKRTELEITMNSAHNHYNDIFERYHGPYYIMTQRFKLPETTVTKKNNENENEYKNNETKIKKIRLYPHITVPFNKLENRYEHWLLLQRVYSRNWNHVESYKHGTFKVEIYEEQGLGIRYLFFNEYDQEIQWYHID